VVLGDVCEGSRRVRVRVERWEGWVPLPFLSRGLRVGREHVPFWILLRALAWDSRSRCISRTAAGASADEDAMVCRCFHLRRRLSSPASGVGVCECGGGVVFFFFRYGLPATSA
jgi:hypothetical protein